MDAAPEEPCRRSRAQEDSTLAPEKLRKRHMREDLAELGGSDAGREATPILRHTGAGCTATTPCPTTAPLHEVRGGRREGGRRGCAGGVDQEAETEREKERREAC
jgi:hypothetical protein